MKLMLTDTRGAFLTLFEAKTVNGEGDPAYSGSFLIDPSTPAGKKLIAEVEAAEEQVAKDKWGAKAEVTLKAIRANDRAALHDGDKKADYDGFPGNKYVSTRSKTRPLAIDRDRTPVSAADGRIYSGCYVNAQIELWAQDNAYGKRINAQLKGVQFVRDGDAFGGGGTPASPDDFGDLGVDGDDDGGDLV